MFLEKNAIHFSKILHKIVHSNVSSPQFMDQLHFEAKTVKILLLKEFSFFSLVLRTAKISLIEIYTKTLKFQSKLCISYFDVIKTSLLH